MKRILILILTLSTALPAFSQHIVTGVVKDKSGAAVPFATLRFFPGNKPSQLETGKIADMSGRFEVSLKDTGNYVVKASGLGYKDTSREFTVTSSHTNVTVYMVKSANYLSAVTVTASSNPPMIERKIDRIVMNVSNNPLATGKSSLELFQLAPGVFVNDEDISVNGNSGTQVMVNGRILQLSGEDLTNYLTNLRAEDIQSIEIIAHPPAQYDAKGTGGLINIILKKNKKAGFSGSLSAGYTQGKYAGTDDGLSLNFHKNKWTLFGSYYFNHLKSFENDYISRSTNSAMLTTVTNRINNVSGHLLRLGGTFNINKNQYIGLEYNGSIRNGKEPYNAESRVAYNNPDSDQKVVGTYPHDFNSIYNDIGLNYHLVTDKKGSVFTILSDYLIYKRNSIAFAESRSYDVKNNFLEDTAFKNSTPILSKIFTAEANYKKVISGNTSLSAGAKLTNTRINNRAHYQYLKKGTYIENSFQDFIYDYDEEIYAGYLNFNTEILKTSVQLGLRGEYTNLTGTLTQLNNDVINSDKYFNLFPSIFLKKDVNKGKTNFFTFNYSRRIERPSYSDLNPYEFYADNYLVARGNPYLKPSFINSFSLAFTLKNSYSVTAFLDQQKDMIGEYIHTNPDTLLTIDMRNNFGERYNYGFQFYAPVNITPWWQMQNDATIRYESILAKGYSIKSPIYGISTTQEFSLPDGFMISAHAIYYSKDIFGSFMARNISQIDIGIQKKFFHDKLIAKAAANDIFGLRTMKTIGYYDGGQMLFNSSRQWQTYSLSLIYNFDLGKAFKVEQLKNSNTNEKNRLK